VRAVGLDKDPGLFAYTPFWQQAPLEMSLVIRTQQSPEALASAVRAEIWHVDSDVPVPEIASMRQIVSAAVSTRRFQLALIAGFAMAALLLAGLGIFGVVSYAIEQRRNEIGIRMALGATARDIGRLVLGQGLRPVVIGLAAGVVLSLWVARAIRSLLFGVVATDPTTFVAVPLLLLVVAVSACALPALRAIRIDPMGTLRGE
jgi:ABC-type antimicrobial peptide transport system permease subunit